VDIKDNDEKDSAFRGFCKLIQTNPAGVAKVWRSSCESWNVCSLTPVLTQSFMWFCNAVVRWQHPSPELNEMFAHVCLHSHHIAWLCTSLKAPPDLASVQRDGGTAMGESTLDLRAVHRRTPAPSIPLMRSISGISRLDTPYLVVFSRFLLVFSQQRSR